MSDCKIVGIVLVKNEDIYIERVLLNILEFCDEIIVADNISSDRTGSIIKDLQKQKTLMKQDSMETGHGVLEAMLIFRKMFSMV